MRAQLVAILASSITMTCSAQDTYAWGENVGWINFDGHPIAPDGSSLGNGRVRVMGKHSGLAGYAQLRGHAWGENIGWINFGPTTLTTDDFGVRVLGHAGDSVRALSGYAWGENVGWISFSLSPADTATPLMDSLGDPAWPRIEGDRLRGYAWGENIGWINFDDNEHFVVPRCAADFAGAPGVIDIDDVLAFLQAFAMGSLAADMDRNATLDIDDVIDFLNEFSVGDCI